MLILKAKEHNWGLIGPGDWETRSWKINDDGWYEYKETYRSGNGEIVEIPNVVEEDVLSSGQLVRLKEMMACTWPTEKAEIDDGTAWEFKMYDGGTVVKHRDLGYIYGLEPYESIVKLLREEQDGI